MPPDTDLGHGASKRRTEDRSLTDLLGIQNGAQTVRKLFDGGYTRIGWIDYAVRVADRQRELEPQIIYQLAARDRQQHPRRSAQHPISPFRRPHAEGLLGKAPEFLKRSRLRR